jgi:hypothetical protein
MNPKQREYLIGAEVTAHPWPEIAAFFRWLVDGGSEWARPMLELVERIAASPHADHLFAIRAMHTLIVAGTNPFRRGCEALRIDYDARQEEFRFEYVEQPFTERRWRKRCPSPEAFGTLEHLARMKGWIPALAPEPR